MLVAGWCGRADMAEYACWSVQSGICNLPAAAWVGGGEGVKHLVRLSAAAETYGKDYMSARSSRKSGHRFSVRKRIAGESNYRLPVGALAQGLVLMRHNRVGVLWAAKSCKIRFSHRLQRL